MDLLPHIVHVGNAFFPMPLITIMDAFLYPYKVEIYSCIIHKALTGCYKQE
jgi:hypothetical protein